MVLPRTATEQTRLDAAAKGMVLYHFASCPFCVKVRRAMRRLGLKVELRDAKRNEAYKRELMAGGGQYQTPCLRIFPTKTHAAGDGNGRSDGSSRWLYESSDIIAFLESEYGLAPSPLPKT